MECALKVRWDNIRELKAMVVEYIGGEESTENDHLVSIETHFNAEAKGITEGIKQMRLSSS